jgi:hypothetical protein
MQAVAAAAALCTVTGWVWGGFLDQMGEPLMLIGFLAIFTGIAVALATVATDPATRGRSWRTRRRFNPFVGVPRRLRRTLVLIGIIAAISAAAGLLSTGGYSQEPRNDRPGCEWPIVTDHGSTVICTSHSRWLRVGRGFEHGFLGFVAVFAAIESGVFAAASIRRRRGE